MERWKLLTAVASGVLSVGGSSAYYWWPRSAAEVADAAAVDPAAVSPHAIPPEPIRDGELAAPSAMPPAATSAAWVTPASYQEPAPAPAADPAPAPDSSGDSPTDTVPPRPSFDRVSEPTPPPSVYGDAPSAPAYGTSLTDQTSPVPDDPAAGGAPPLASDPPPPSAPVESAPVENAPVETAPSEMPVASEPVPTLEPEPIATEAAPAEAASPQAAPLSTLPEPANSTAPAMAVPATPRLRTSNSPVSRFQSSSPVAGHRLTSAAPGDRKLEGTQSPALSLQREAPEEIQVGKPTKFVIKVRNTGPVAAHDVVVTDAIPTGTRFLAATPTVTPAADGTLSWELGDLEPGHDAVLTLELLPEAEGEIGSVAEVTFRTQASVRTIATRPLLKIEHSGPSQVLIGDEAPFQIAVSNPGTGVATGVVIEVDVPKGLAHDGGREIMSDQFDLRPNETRKLDLVLKAVEPGAIESIVRAVGDGDLAAEHRTRLEVVAPQLQLSTAGPTRRFLDRPVKYLITVANPGTAPAQDIQLTAHLPRGLKFTAADKKGAYDQQSHAVIWSLEALPPGEQGVVELTALPTDTGEQKLHVEGRGALGLQQEHDHVTVVEDITDLVFTVTDDNVPIEVGSETTYQIRVANNGTKVAQNVRLAIQVPAGMEVVDADGPTQFQQQGDQLLTLPVAELGQREEAAYRVTAKGTSPGDHVLRVQLLSDEFSTPVTKEEITKVYSDK